MVLIVSNTETHPPTPDLEQFVEQLKESNEDAVAFYRPDGREVLVEVWDRGHKYIYQKEAGAEFGHYFKFHDWEETL